MCELPQFLRQNMSRVNELLGPESLSWGHIYELPFLEQMATLFILIGLHVPLHEAVQTEDPQEVVLSWAEDNSPLDRWYDAHESEIEVVRTKWKVATLR